MSALSSAKQSEVKAWEEEIHPCEHTLCLVQDPPQKLEQQALAHCANCELSENLWLCLTCGNLGCGRRQYDGSGGNNHAIEHYEKTGHGVSCKLGTITPEGTAGIRRELQIHTSISSIRTPILDIYCYICNDAKLDNDLSTHLANWGINVSQQLKTEKSMTELVRWIKLFTSVELSFDLSLVLAIGAESKVRFQHDYRGWQTIRTEIWSRIHRFEKSRK